MENAGNNRLALEICEEALSLSSPERAPWIRRRCGENGELNSMVFKILTNLTAGEQAMTTGGAVLPASADQIGRTINEYEIREVLGQGGMGVVYLALRHQQGVQHKVALKMIHPALMDDDSLRRFVTEQKALARLRHPYISTFIEMGETDDGVPYYVMEYVEGTDILSFADGRRLSIAERIGLWLKVCDAVQSSHRNLVLHRDIKPTNVLVQEDGLPKLVDFGVAKLIEDGADTGHTQALGANLTVDYASPERLMRGESSTLEDQYSLVVLLHELLAGVKPFDRSSKNLSELVTEVGELTAVAMGKRYASLEVKQQELIAHSRATTARSLRSVLTSDVNAIIRKALSPDPEQRYASIDALIADISRYQSLLPVHAKTVRWGYRLRRYLLRNRIQAGAAALVTTVLITALVFTTAQVREANRQLERAQAIGTFLSSILSAPSTRWNSALRMGPDASMQEVLSTAAAQLHESASVSPEIRTQLHLSLAEAFIAWDLVSESVQENRRALAVSRASLPPDHVLQERSLTNLATVLDIYGKGEDLDEALGYVHESLAWLDQYAPDDLQTRAKVLGELGYNADIRGDLEVAIENYELAFDLWIRGGGPEVHPLMALALGLSGRAYFREGDLIMAKQAWLHSKEILERIPGVAMLEWVLAYYGLLDIALLQGDAAAIKQSADDILAMADSAVSDDRGVNEMLPGAAYAYTLVGELDRADEVLRPLELKFVDPVYADARLYARSVRAHWLHASGRNVEALTEFNTLKNYLNAAAPNSRFFIHLGMAETTLQLGLLDQAQEAVDLAVKIVPARLGENSLIKAKLQGLLDRLPARRGADQVVSSE